MKFIGSNIGRCVKLFSWDEVKPVHGVNTAILVATIAERFNFQFKPSLPLPPETVIKFGDGSTVIDKQTIAIQKMDLYSDGFGIDCANTEDAKAVSDEMIKWAREVLGYRDFAKPPQIIYLSHIVVEFDDGFENIFGAWKKLQQLLNGAVKQRYNMEQPVDLFRLQWRGDPHKVVNNVLVSDFYIERRTMEGHASNRWHCSGPLPTKDWISLLENIESLAKAK